MRDMKWNTQQEAPDFDKKIQLMLVRAFIFVFLLINVKIFVFPSEEEESALSVHMVAIIDLIVGMIFGYYWGSSKGSKDKDGIKKEVNDEPDH